MYKKIIALVILLAIGSVVLTGCKKKGEVSAEPKTADEYKAEAEKNITEENLDAEMEKLEKEIAEDEKAERLEGL